MKFKLPSKAGFIFFLSLFILLCGFYSNTWQVVEQSQFDVPPANSESLILGRLVKSRQDGIFSSGGFVGLGSQGTTPPQWSDRPFSFQYLAYRDGLRFGAYNTYESQIGGQGILFSIVDELIPNSPAEKLAIFYFFASLFSAITLAIIVLWFYWEFGLLVGLFVLASITLSQWLVVYGRHLFLSIWAFYIPMAAVMLYLKSGRSFTKKELMKFGVLVFIVVFLKCFFNGYELITTTLIMMIVPLVYYMIKDKLGVGKSLRVMIMTVIGSGLAILFSLSILIFQIASVEGSFQNGVSYIMNRLAYRTYADPSDFPSKLGPSLESDPGTVIKLYLDQTYFDLNSYIPTARSFISDNLYKIRYLYLICLFMFMSIYLYYQRNWNENKTKWLRNRALIITTWFSILAPLSWFIIFKSHSFSHVELNVIAWQMPFTFFGFALLGCVVEKFIPKLKILLTQRLV